MQGNKGLERVSGEGVLRARGFREFVEGMEKVGFQATELGRGYRVLREMIRDPEVTRFLAFTSNIISSGLREVIAHMVRKGWFQAIVTTVGSIEEDVMKSLGEFWIGTWDVDDVELREKGINRIGNIFVPNERYEELEKFLHPIFDRVYEEYGGKISPMELSREIGK